MPKITIYPGLLQLKIIHGVVILNMGQDTMVLDLVRHKHYIMPLVHG